MDTENVSAFVIIAAMLAIVIFIVISVYRYETRIRKPKSNGPRAICGDDITQSCVINDERTYCTLEPNHDGRHISFNDDFVVTWERVNGSLSFDIKPCSRG